MEDEDINIKILDVKEINNQLRVKIETDFGIKNLGFSVEDKYLDPYTRQPRWHKKVHDCVKELYGRKECTEKSITDDVGKTFNLGELAPKTVSGLHKRLVQVVGVSSEKAEEIEKYFESIGEIRKYIVNGNKELPFDKETNNTLIDYCGGKAIGFWSEKSPEERKKLYAQKRGKVKKKDKK